MITRKIGKIVRGDATPFQLVAASVLGSCLAFLPGFTVAPGLFLLWIALLVILNANLFIAGLVGIAAKLIALLIAPISFALGRVLLEGPLRGMFATLVNAPVFAWFGFEFPLVTGGQVLAIILGVVFGLLILRATRAIWHKLAALEKDSAGFQRWTNNPWVKATSFIVIGGIKGKESYERVLARRIGNPIRVLGLVVVAVFLVVGFVVARFFDDAIVTAAIRSGLERANGATVDLERAQFEPTAGRLTLTRLAMADPGDLATNLFAAESIEAKLSTTSVLRKRLVVDTVTVVGAAQGAQRETPGELIGPPPDDEPGWKIELPDMQSIDEVLKNAEVWKQRLATLRRWLERISNTEPEATGPSYEDILRERIEREGYARIADEGLVEQAPKLLIRRIEADQVRAAALPEEQLRIVAQNVSTHPRLVPEPPRITVTSSSERLKFDLAVNAATGAASLAQVDFWWKGLPVDEVAGQLATADGTPPVQGGTVDIGGQGALGFVDSNLPLTLTLHDTRLSIAGSQPTPISELAVPVMVRGPLDQPAIRVDMAGLQDALVSAGKRELTRRLTGELEKRLGGGDDADRAEDEGAEGAGKKQQRGENLEDTAKGLLEGFLKKRKEE